MTIQDTRSSSVIGIRKSSITAGKTVTTTVWSRAVKKAPKPITASTRGTGGERRGMSVVESDMGCLFRHGWTGFTG